MTPESRGRGEGSHGGSVRAEGAGTSESGAWGSVAIAILSILFVLAAAATVHSVVVTFF